MASQCRGRVIFRSRKRRSDSDDAVPVVPSPEPVRRAMPDDNELTIRLPAGAQGQQEFAQALGETVAHIVATQLGAGTRGFAVCGASSGAGASFVAANLALAISHLGLSTLLIDADLHGASQERYFATLRPPMGLQQVLRGEVDNIDKTTFFEVAPLLSVLHAGGSCEDANEMIGGRPFQDIVHRAMRSYDCTILDTPPANRSSDARRVAAIAGRAIVVARHRVSYLDDMALVAKQLRQDQVEVVGAVLNAVEGQIRAIRR